jgi:hypothetical protein
MPGLVPGIHDFYLFGKGVDGRDKLGHDVEEGVRSGKWSLQQNNSQRI